MIARDALIIRDLKKVYASGTVALKGIDLAVQEGDFFALLGINGAGKSTTIGIISSLIRKTTGQVIIFEHDLDKAPAQAKACIGIVPQETNFSLFETVLNILINQAGYYGVPRRIAIQRAEHYLNTLSLWDKRHQPAFRLSGGMKRRLMIARALMNQPKLLILDEPTAGVDIEFRYGIWQFLRELNEAGTTIILTTHYLEEAEHLCKHVAIIHHGQIIEYAPIKTLIGQMDSQTVLLDLEKPLHHLPDLDGFKGHLLDEMTLEVVSSPHASLNDLFTLLNASQIKVLSIRNKTNRLEEFFVKRVSNLQG
jgi:ABC-2 type transport system ATP-binding protein